MSFERVAELDGALVVEDSRRDCREPRMRVLARLGGISTRRW
jgi:hypothetical protein